ncbi:hypothetical protein O7606_07145 [Micromonospora sp. WMMD882]|uniref:hypothetical protein n=1 Tax=Micromonospora sp. WMMD882 TaxID=3015151 RepID=UPI00248AF3B7|nr:hypothetical protein [Micromonospora sp. WMMD882]WBB81148.1 hypothetical protein O7606_07145 [Micromonospora sp. WMMD882]
MNEPVTTESYAACLRRLAELTAQATARRAEAQAWHERQCAAAERAVREADEQVRRAEAEVTEATELVERVDAEATHLWQVLRGRVGAGGRRLGDPPGAARDASTDPMVALERVRELLDRTRQPGDLPGSTNPLLALCGVLGATVAYLMGLAARAAGARYGGDLAVGLPVIALVVSLLGPLIGLWPAKLLADRRHALLGPRAMTIVLVAGLLTTVFLLVTSPG